MSGLINTAGTKSGVLGCLDPVTDCWIHTAGRNDPASGDSEFIDFNLDRYTQRGAAHVGPEMSRSGAVFTFPTPGLWRVTASVGFYSYVYQNYVDIQIHGTGNNSSYNELARSFAPFSSGQGNNNINANVVAMVNFGVWNTTNYKIKFKWARQTSSATMRGESASLHTSFLFERISYNITTVEY